MTRWTAPLTLLLFVACGPPKVPSSGDEHGGGASSEGEDGEDGEDGSSSAATTQGGSDGADEGDSDDADTDSPDDGGFVPDEDYPKGDECTVFDQDCPEGEKCIPNNGSWGIYSCVPVLGNKQIGEDCVRNGDRSDDCDADSHCWPVQQNADGEYVGSCVPFCQGDADDPDIYQNAFCQGQGESCDDYRCVFVGQVGIPYCVKTCDLYLDGCEEGFTCHYESGYVDDFVCMVDTIEAQLGEPCDWTNDCDEGLFCVNADHLPACEDDSCCTPYCALGDDAACDQAMPGTACYGPLIWSQEPREACSVVGACSLEW